MNTRLLYNTSAIIEILTGIVLLVAPLLVIGLLLGDELSPAGVAVARVLGTGLLAVGVAGWELQGQDIHLAPRVGLCIYNVGAAIIFVMLGTIDGMNGILLWPVAILHAMIGVTMLWMTLVPLLKTVGE